MRTIWYKISGIAGCLFDGIIIAPIAWIVEIFKFEKDA